MRHDSADRLRHLIDCATRVFIERGYRHAQMADVAAAMGVAKGTPYLYVESKEALFELTLRHADPEVDEAPPAALPVPTPKPGATLRYVRDGLAQNREPPSLTAALARKHVRDARGELEGIVREIYALLARNRRRIEILDSAARDYPELARLWFDGARGTLVGLLARYIARRTERGLFRPVPDVAVAARLVLETIVYWAVHRHFDDRAPRAPEETIEASVVHFIASTLLGGVP